ncbi:MAG TPA: hypothetical protein VE869_10905 [Gemmatimonas sp.]|nr:hypothetical protein [Gemmatimonas sp.]
MISEPNRERAFRMLRHILSGLDAGAEPAPWIAAAGSLHAAGAISTEVLHYLVEKVCESLISRAVESDEELVALMQQIDVVERGHGLAEGESFYTDDAPDDWLALNASWEKRADAIVNEYLRAHGATEIADARVNRESFDTQTLLGARSLWPHRFDVDDEFGSGRKS